MSNTPADVKSLYPATVADLSMEEITAHRIACIESRIAADKNELKRLKRVQKLLSPAPVKEPEAPAEPAITMELGDGKSAKA